VLIDQLISGRQVGLMDLSVAGDPVGLLLLIPARSDSTCKQLHVSAHIRSGQLVAALLPWTLSRDACTKLIPSQPSREPAFPGRIGDLLNLGDPEPGKHRRKLTPAIRRAVEILKVPQVLHEVLSSGRRPYCIWYSGDGTSGRPGLETASLRLVLGHYGARDAGYKADVRLVFVHVGALATLHQLEALADRRKKQPEVQFYLYGTHDIVPRERWGIRPVYPLGKSLKLALSLVLILLCS
jgi:hypothetical protein